MFTKAFFSAAVACGLLASSVNAHIVITSPVPYGQDSLTNSPLEADGSDFPCKQRSGVYDVTKMNNMPVGVPQKLAFKGGATHGGGSCQVSVTLDKEPTKDSKWKVIKSILGSCPNGLPGNANGSPNFEDNPTYEFSIPKGMPNGEYTLAWTWFNKIGNREMYMNCAPITVTGGADSKDVYNSLPDMFVANIGNGCGTTESEDFVFPQCGLYAETVAKTALGSSTTGTCPTGAAGGGSGSDSGSGSVSSAPASPTSYGSGSGSGADSSAAAPSGYGAGSSAAAPTGYGGAAQTSAAESAPAYAAPSEAASASGESAQGSGAQIATVTTMATVTASGYAPAGAAAPTGAASPPSYGTSGTAGTESSGSDASNGTSSTGTGSCEGGTVTCSNDGSVVCIGSSQWGMCNAGCAVPMSLATGTTCSGGVIAKREMINHLRRHIAHAHKF